MWNSVEEDVAVGTFSRSLHPFGRFPAHLYHRVRLTKASKLAQSSTSSLIHTLDISHVSSRWPIVLIVLQVRYYVVLPGPGPAVPVSTYSHCHNLFTLTILFNRTCSCVESDIEAIPMRIYQYTSKLDVSSSKGHLGNSVALLSVIPSRLLRHIQAKWVFSRSVNTIHMYSLLGTISLWCLCGGSVVLLRSSVTQGVSEWSKRIYASALMIIRLWYTVQIGQLCTGIKANTAGKMNDKGVWGNERRVSWSLNECGGQ